jgi:hypothetical protein
VRLAVAVALSVTVCGCAVLTQSQVDAARGFAKVTEAYVAVPAKAVDAYAAAHAQREVLKLAASHSDAAQKMDEIVTRRLKWRDESEQVTKALAVLNAYSTLLDTLAQPGLGDADDALTGLGTALDGTIATYNAKSGANVPSLGAAIAAGARALGGVVYAQRQAAIIKASVDAADEPIHALLKDVEALLWPYASKNPDDNFAADAAALKDELGLAASKPAFTYGEARGYYDALLSMREGQRLADAAIEATKACGTAHRKLKEALAVKASLSHVIDEVRAYGDQVSAAMKVKGEVEDAEKK